MLKKKTLGTVALSGGAGSLTLKITSVLNKRITVVYSGNGNFKSSQAVTPVLTRGMLKIVAAFDGRARLTNVAVFGHAETRSALDRADHLSAV